MISNQKFETAIAEINSITGMELHLFTKDGVLLASSETEKVNLDKIRSEFIEMDESEAEIDGFHIYLIRVEDESEYVFMMKGESFEPVIGQMACAQIRIVAISFAEQYDRNSFMQNVLLGNLLPIDMITKAKKLHIDDSKRVVFIIDTAKKNNDLVLETVKNLSNIKSRDFVFRTDESSVILVKAIPSDITDDEETHSFVKDIASQLVDNIHMEVMVKVRVGCGNPAETLKDASRSYQEAAMALEVGRVFYAEQDTIFYGRLGIGRLIYQLPLSLCEMFIQEVFGDTVPDILEDEEAMNTINKFFENSLNISETARQLYLHRNTLVYRLERIEKTVGLDIRNFEDAMTFRIAVMVLAHMKENA